MTLKDIKAFARLVCDWCLEQDDLRGFHVGIVGPPDWPRVRVLLDWPNDWHAAKEYSLEEIQSVRAIDARLAPLEALAREARERAARIADPNRLPG